MVTTPPLQAICAARRIWAVGAVHGDVSRLRTLHDRIAPNIRYGDRIVYCGNMIGVGSNSYDTVTELLHFRRWFLSMPPFTDPQDVIYLRGAQEEMWQKLHQLQFAPNPEAILNWMLERGIDATIRAYGADPTEGLAKARQGTLPLTYWTGSLMDAVHSAPGHDAFYASLKRAAYTDATGLLFVHTGLDVTKPLSRQRDAFWWAGRCFGQIAAPYGDFARLVRGFDPDRGGYRETPHTLTVDGGCGYGGPLTAACLDTRGDVLEMVEA